MKMIVEIEMNLTDYSDARLRELLEGASEIRNRLINEIRRRYYGEEGYGLHNLDFLNEEDHKRIETP